MHFKNYATRRLRLEQPTKARTFWAELCIFILLVTVFPTLVWIVGVGSLLTILGWFGVTVN